MIFLRLKWFVRDLFSKYAKLIEGTQATDTAVPCIYASILAEFGGSPPPDVMDDVKGLPPLNVYGGQRLHFITFPRNHLTYCVCSGRRDGSYSLHIYSRTPADSVAIQSRGTLSTWFLHLVRNPHMLQTAQDEIDRVIGNARLPEFGDRESLPYLKALLEETYRCVLIQCDG